MEIKNKKFNNWLNRSKTNVDVFNTAVCFLMLGIAVGAILLTILLI